MSFLRGQDAWRRHPIFTWGFFQAVPGIREGTAAFALYCAYEAVAHRASQRSAPAPAAHGPADVVQQAGLEGGHAGAAVAAKHH